MSAGNKVYMVMQSGTADERSTRAAGCRSCNYQPASPYMQRLSESELQKLTLTPTKDFSPKRQSFIHFSTVYITYKSIYNWVTERWDTNRMPLRWIERRPQIHISSNKHKVKVKKSLTTRGFDISCQRYRFLWLLCTFRTKWTTWAQSIAGLAQYRSVGLGKYRENT